MTSLQKKHVIIAPAGDVAQMNTCWVDVFEAPDQVQQGRRGMLVALLGRWLMRSISGSSRSTCTALRPLNLYRIPHQCSPPLQACALSCISSPKGATWTWQTTRNLRGTYPRPRAPQTSPNHGTITFSYQAKPRFVKFDISPCSPAVLFGQFNHP